MANLRTDFQNSSAIKQSKLGVTTVFGYHSERKLCYSKSKVDFSRAEFLEQVIFCEISIHIKDRIIFDQRISFCQCSGSLLLWSL